MSSYTARSIIRFLVTGLWGLTYPLIAIFMWVHMTSHPEHLATIQMLTKMGVLGIFVIIALVWSVGWAFSCICMIVGDPVNEWVEEGRKADERRHEINKITTTQNHALKIKQLSKDMPPEGALSTPK